MSDFKIEANSTTWLAVKAHAESEIEKARTRLEMPSLTQTETDVERGQIKALRALLDLGKEQIKITVTSGGIEY
ncbi:hypothetical protein ACHMW7_16170 [Aminobacter sp. UC22_36]|uniref:hypothetical protein n=1 Tax=Aminobacter sp. UC22_36 TaxID=3374549 RepID=UPI003757D95C